MINRQVFNVLAVSAPHWQSRTLESSSQILDSETPYSLQCALRLAVESAQKRKNCWQFSNWRSINGVNDSVLLMKYFEEDIEYFKQKLIALKPKLIFIGCMSLSYFGAVKLAQVAKKLLRDPFIVIGGKHINETLFTDSNGELVSHPASVICQMLEERKPVKKNDFDLAISGEAEDIVEFLGNKLIELHLQNRPMQNIYSLLLSLNDGVNDKVEGRWLVAWITSKKGVEFIQNDTPFSTGRKLPSTAQLFGLSGSFAVFNADVTAHTHSNMGMGCKFDCFYCSERSSINGKLINSNFAHCSLIDNFVSIISQAMSVNSARRISAFVEDSILLGGNNKTIRNFVRLYKQQLDNYLSNAHFEYGAQFTIDYFVNRDNYDLLRELFLETDLRYVLFGIETVNEKIARKINKNVISVNWTDKSTIAIKEVYDFSAYLGLPIGCCVTVLWGLGESQSERVSQLKLLKSWRNAYGGLPNVISFNWATLHPMREVTLDSSDDYLRWGTSKGSGYDYYFQRMFGEASTQYLIPNVCLPTVKEFEELYGLMLEYELLKHLPIAVQKQKEI